MNEVERVPGVFYFHPWEVDPDQPRVKNSRLKARIRHYTNLATMASSIEGILREFNWGRMDEVFHTLLEPSKPLLHGPIRAE